MISRSRFGFGLRAIRDEESGGGLGIDTTRHKTVAWLLSALLTGPAGGIYAYWISYIDPGRLRHGDRREAFVILLLGGPGTVFGPVVGAVFIEIATALTWSNLLNYHSRCSEFSLWPWSYCRRDSHRSSATPGAPFGLRISRR